MATRKSKQVVMTEKLKPGAELGPQFLKVQVVDVPAVKDGEFLLKTLFTSVDPTHRVYANPSDNYLPASMFKEGAPLPAITSGVVIESKHPDWPVGSYAMGLLPWSEFSVVDPKTAFALSKMPKTTLPLDQVTGYCNPVVGLAAWAGVHCILKVKAGDVVCCSTAAGAVGSLVGQLARAAGAKKVIGITSDDNKCASCVKDFGYDACLNYKKLQGDALAAALKDAAGGTIDKYFDNVGGDISSAVVSVMSQYSHLAVCGSISSYNSMQSNGQLADGFRGWAHILYKRMTVRGFICLDHAAEAPDWQAQMIKMGEEGKLKFAPVNTFEGLEKLPDAMQHLFAGKNTGKVLVRVAQE